MLNKSSKVMFFSILISGSMITISANSWLSTWMGLEINLLSFIPLMSDNKLMSTESSLKYFLTQALASSILLFTVILAMMNLTPDSMFFTKMMIFSSLLMKSGSPPFHYWFPNVMEGLTWLNSFILMTWQKIAPLMLISYTMLQPLITISVILSSTIGALMGLNQTSLRKLMVYSSINHLSWMLAAMYNNNSLWMNYFMFYSFLTGSMIFTFNTFKTSHINQLFTLFFNNKYLKLMLFLNLLSLGGLPPFMGFFPKLMIIQLLTINNQMTLLMIMVMMTLITLYFYLRLCYSSFILNYYENNWMNFSFYSSFNMKIMMFITFFSLFSFFMISSLYLFF